MASTNDSYESQGMAIASAERPAPTPAPSGEGVRSIRIEVANGGFLVSVDRMSEKMPGEAPAQDRPLVVKDVAELQKLIGEQLGQPQGYSESPLGGQGVQMSGPRLPSSRPRPQDMG